MSEGDVAAVVEVERGFDITIFAHPAENILEGCRAVCGEGFGGVRGAGRPGCVVFVAEFAGFVAGLGQGRVEGVVTESQKRCQRRIHSGCDGRGNLQHAGDHLFIFFALGDVV